MGLFTYIIATTCLLAVMHISPAATWRTIDGAFTMDDMNLYMYSGDQVMLFNLDWMRAISVDKRYGMLIPIGFQVQAVVETLEGNFKLLYYGKDYGYFTKREGNQIVNKKLKYGRKRAFLRNGGPDAAVKANGKIYFFKGCMMAERIQWNKWGEPEDVSATMGLPCDIDAAWREDKSATVVALKGQQFWRWQANLTGTDAVTGPYQFVDHYEMKDWISP